jgi:hypothetical protein
VSDSPSKRPITARPLSAPRSKATWRGLERFIDISNSQTLAFCVLIAYDRFIP